MNMLFLMNKTKDQISRVSSHDLYWENKMYKRKRSIRFEYVTCGEGDFWIRKEKVAELKTSGYV